MDIVRKFRRYLIIFGFSFVLFLFVLMSVLTKASYINAFDETIFDFYEAIRNKGLDFFFMFFTYLGEEITIVSLMIILLVLPNRKKIGLPVLFSTGVSAIINFVLKHIVSRQRPNIEHFFSNVPFGYPYPDSLSFPSGHAQNGMVFYFILLFLILHYYMKNEEKRKVLIIVLPFIVSLIGISRNYIGVHYPTDVLGGWTLAIMVIVGFFVWFYHLRKKMVMVTIDRKKGTTHPNHDDIIYEVNYGYVKGIMAADNEEQDAYVLGVEEPIDSFYGELYAIVVRKNDIEDKWIVVKKGTKYTKEEIMEKIKFQEKYFDSEIILLKDLKNIE